MRGLESDVNAWKLLIKKRQKLDKGPQDSVEDLEDMGFSIRMIANILNVTVTDVLRWRGSDSALHHEMAKMDELIALCELISDRYMIYDQASWFESWLVDTCVIDIQEVYYNGHKNLVLDFASRRKTAEQVLEEYDPQWRDAPPSLWETIKEPERFSKILGGGTRGS